MAVSALMRSLTDRPDGPDAVILLPDGVPSLQSPRSGSKRKAQAFLPSPPPRRRHCRSPSRSSSPFPLTLAPTITKTPSSVLSRPSSPATLLRPPVPEPLSINSIIRQYCQSRLYVRPLHWTSDHLQLLDCRFALKRARQKGRSKPRRSATSRDDQSRLTDNVTHGQQQRQAAKPTTSQTAIHAANLLLSQAHNKVVKHWAVQELLSVYNVHHLNSDRLPFRFGQRVVAILQTGGTFSHPSSNSASPSLAYLDLNSMPSLRHDSIKIPRCNGLNPPIARLRQKKLRRLQPPAEVKDPYIVAILIALAQEQRQANRRQGTGVVTAEKVTAAGKSGVNAASSQFRASTMTSLPSPPEATERKPQEIASSFKVHLLAIPTVDARSLYFYTARVSAEFLDRFDMPSRFSPSSPFVISYYRIPLTPIAKLTKELESVLCARSRRREEPGSGDGVAAGPSSA